MSAGAGAGPGREGSPGDGDRAPDAARGAPAAQLSGPARDRLAIWLRELADDPASLSSVRDPEQAWRVHVADSLTGLEPVAAQLGERGRVADLGSGAGFPGAVLAAALPAAEVDLIEAVRRKCDFLRRAIAASGIANLRVICRRSEEWARDRPPAGGREAYEVVTARAVGRLSTLAELASPLLGDGGLLVAWKGRRDPGEEAELARAGQRLAMGLEETRWVGPYAGSRHRHLHLIRKRGPTPADLPRRPGIAKKRPLGRR